MEYRRLGRSDLVVSVVGLGCYRLGTKAGRSESSDIVRRSIDLGVNYFDTADVYGDGASEECLGEALGSRRKDVIIATKVGRVHYGAARKLGRDSSPSHIRSAVEGSLRRLKTDWIDLYQIHWPDPDTAIEETLDAMLGLVRRGLVRYVGVCNYRSRDLARAFAACPELASLQAPYNMFHRELEQSDFPFCVNRAIGIVPYWPLAKGRLVSAGPRSADDPVKAAPESELNAFSGRFGRPLSHLALAWLLGKPGVSAVIPGASRLDQLEENCGAAGWNLSPTEMLELDRILAMQRGRDPGDQPKS